MMIFKAFLTCRPWQSKPGRGRKCLRHKWPFTLLLQTTECALSCVVDVLIWSLIGGLACLFSFFCGSHLKLRTFWKIGPDGSHGSNQSGRLALGGHFFSRKKIRPTLTLSHQTEIALRLVSTCTSCRGQVSPLSSQGWTCNLGGTGEAWRRLKKDSKLGIPKNTNRCSLHCPRRVWHLVEHFSSGDFYQAMISEPSGPPANQNHCICKWSSYIFHWGLQE